MIRLIASVFLIFLLFSANAQNISKRDSLIQLAELRLQAKAFESALVYVNEAAQIVEDEKVLILKSKINALTGNFTEAFSYAEEAERLNPNSINVIYQKAEIYFLQGDEKEAIKILNDAIDDSPENGDLYYYRGILYNQTKRYSKSIPDFERALDLDNDIETYRIHLNKGLSHMRLEEYETALEEMDKAIELNKKEAIVYHSRGMVYYAMRFYDEAVADFSKSIEIYSNNPETLFNLGMAHFRLEVIDEACVYFHRSCELGNSNGCKMMVMECGRK
jgi:tetratricopeptide (TPR) repeat protein